MTNLVFGNVRGDGCDPSALSFFDGEEHCLEVGARVVAVEQDAVSLLPHAALAHADATRRLHKHTQPIESLLFINIEYTIYRWVCGSRGISLTGQDRS